MAIDWTYLKRSAAGAAEWAWEADGLALDHDAFRPLLESPIGTHLPMMMPLWPEGSTGFMLLRSSCWILVARLNSHHPDGRQASIGDHMLGEIPDALGTGQPEEQLDGERRRRGGSGVATLHIHEDARDRRSSGRSARPRRARLRGEPRPAGDERRRLEPRSTSTRIPGLASHHGDLTIAGVWRRRALYPREEKGARQKAGLRAEFRLDPVLRPGPVLGPAFF